MVIHGLLIRSLAERRWASFLPCSPCIAFTVAVLILAGMGCGLGSKNGRGSVNVLLITIDTLRADHLGCYGYDRNTSPAIDALAEEGTRFEWVFAQRALTWPSLASIHLSQYPVQHGVRTNGLMLRDEQVSLATIFSERGYQTFAGAFNASEQNWRGFAHVHKLRDDALADKAVAWLENADDRPFFMWLHMMFPHAPYKNQGKFTEQFDNGYTGKVDGSLETLSAITNKRREISETDLQHIVDLYDGEIACTDAQVKKVLDKLEALGRLDETLVVVTADHGEDLYDHNRYFYHLASVYDSSLRIPLVMRLPGPVAAGKSVGRLTASLDIAPTILDLAGIRKPDSFQGDSLVPFINGATAEGAPVYAEWEDRMVIVRTPDDHYVYNPLDYHPFWDNRNPTARYFVGTEELYDMTADPAQQDNIAQDHPEKLNTLRRKALAWAEKYGWKLGEFDKNPPKIAPELQEQLEDLGYVF